MEKFPLPLIVKLFQNNGEGGGVLCSAGHFDGIRGKMIPSTTPHRIRFQVINNTTTNIQGQEAGTYRKIIWSTFFLLHKITDF